MLSLYLVFLKDVVAVFKVFMSRNRLYLLSCGCFCHFCHVNDCTFCLYQFWLKCLSYIQLVDCCVSVNRAINYDEKDPFLCNACGYCKYAKFDFAVTSRPCCAVDPIENEDDRKKVGSQLRPNSVTQLHTYCFAQLAEDKSSHVFQHVFDGRLNCWVCFWCTWYNMSSVLCQACGVWSTRPNKTWLFFIKSSDGICPLLHVTLSIIYEWTVDVLWCNASYVAA